jgi:hypothetical protein
MLADLNAWTNEASFEVLDLQANKKIKQLLLLTAIVTLSLLFGACQSAIPRVQCNTRTFGTTLGYESKGFTISTVNRGNSLESKQYEEYARQALTFKGMNPVRNSSKADLNISIEYGVSGPREVTSTRAVPVFGQTGISSISTNGTATQSYGGLNYNQTSTVIPTYGITNIATVTQHDTVFDRALRLSANRYGESTPQWVVEVFSTGPSADMNQVAPYMFVAASEAIPNPSGRSEDFIILESAVYKRIFHTPYKGK